ncbi:MAG TPA: hypothetical protein DCY94_05400, partial [Firmicutes bacterium]|nr:hypothetical protein [Bacillota bacterium]
KFPMGENIAPHNDDIYKITNLSRLRFSDFSIKDTTKVEDCTYTFKGSFVANNSPDSFIGKCDTTDSGQYESTLSMTRDGVTITTSITASRKITGNVFFPTYFDNFFPGLAAHNEVETKSITEHFVKIGGGKRLLHFSDEYDFFEIFDLPDYWLVERGLSDIPHPKIFDDLSFDTEDPDLNEAKKIIEEAKKKAKVLMANPVE